MGDEINVDELMQEIESPSAGRPMEGGVDATPEAAPAAPEADWRQSFDWQFDWNGQKVQPDSADKAKTWMQLGYNYSQRAQELNRERSQWQKEREELQGRYKGFDRYNEIDQFAKQNPDWWKYVEEQWNQRSTHGVDPNLQPILERLQQTEAVLQQLKEARSQEFQKEQDQALEAEIDSIRKQYPTIDLNSVDETGRSLEWRVLKHANDNGIQTFRAAFRDYLHDSLVEQAKVQGREAIAKGQAQAARQGVLGKTSVPTKGLQAAQSVRSKSYDDLTREALQELGLG